MNFFGWESNFIQFRGWHESMNFLDEKITSFNFVADTNRWFFSVEKITSINFRGWYEWMNFCEKFFNYFLSILWMIYGVDRCLWIWEKSFLSGFLDDTFCGSMLMDFRKLISISFRGWYMLWMIYVVGLALVGKDILFRFIIECSSLGDRFYPQSYPLFHPLFPLLAFAPYPLFQWYPQSNEILLNLGIKCWNSTRFESNYSSCTGRSTENIFSSSSGGAQEKWKTGWNSVYHQNWWKN
jgi:hypothetical protein